MTRRESLQSELLAVAAPRWIAVRETVLEIRLEVSSAGAFEHRTTRGGLRVVALRGGRLATVSVPASDEGSVAEAIDVALSLAPPSSRPFPRVRPGHRVDHRGDIERLVPAWGVHLARAIGRHRTTDLTLVLQRRDLTLEDSEGGMRVARTHRTTLETTFGSPCAMPKVGARTFLLPSPRPRSVVPLVATVGEHREGGTNAKRRGRDAVRLLPAAAARLLVHLFGMPESAIPKGGERALRALRGTRETPDYEGARATRSPLLRLRHLLDESSALPSLTPTEYWLAPGTMTARPPRAGEVVVEELDELASSARGLTAFAPACLAAKQSNIPLGDISFSIPYSALSALAYARQRGALPPFGIAFGALDVLTPPLRLLDIAWRRI